MNLGRIVLLPDERWSAGDLGKVWDKVYEFFGDPAFERAAFWSGGACEKLSRRPAAAEVPAFVLSGVPLSQDEQKKIRANEQCLFYAEVTTADKSLYSRQLVKAHRVSASSLEISGGGEFLLNERSPNPRDRVSTYANLAHPNFRRKLNLAQVRSRPIRMGSLELEVDSWIKKRTAEGSENLVWDDNGSVVLPMIINAKTSYSSLARVLRLINQPQVRLTIIIDSAPNS